jgi:hypothetical protein
MDRLLGGSRFKCWMVAVMLVGMVCAAGPAVAEESREAQLAAKLYADMSAIADAAEAFRKTNGIVPRNTDELIAAGLIDSVPLLGDDLGGGSYFIQTAYADMDGQGELDAAIFSGEYIPEAVCVEFNARYAQAPINESGSVFDYQAAGEKFPGEVYGRDQKVYAIKWKTSDTVCELNWVIDYN